MSNFTFNTDYGGGVRKGRSPREWRNVIVDSASNAIYEFMNMIAEEASELAPVDTEQLKYSYDIEPYGDGGYKVTFNAYNPKDGYNYAAIQHENLEYHHDIGQAKYLEEPYEAHKSELADFIARNCRASQKTFKGSRGRAKINAKRKSGRGRK